VIVSLLKPEPLSPDKAALTWKNPAEAFRGEAWPGLGNYKFLAGLLFVIMVVLYVIFA